MKFQCNTKPFSDALDLSIINSNVSNFHKKSCVVQLTATKDKLRINVEASRICSEVILNGSGDEQGPVTIFVNSLLLKQLVATLDSNLLVLELSDAGLIIHSGRSTFTLPKMVDEAELELESPKQLTGTSQVVEIDKSGWKFIKDNQMYAIAMSFIHPVYTRVWVGEGGDVLVGDFDNSLFTYSKKGELGSTCLLPDTVINLFISLPDGAKLSRAGKDFIVSYVCDSFTYRTQFSPQYEDEDDIGSYNSEIFIDMMNHDGDGKNCVAVSAQMLSKFLSQSSLLSTSVEDTIVLSVDGNVVSLKDNNVDCKVESSSCSDESYAVEFKTESLRKVITNYGEGDINIIPVWQDDSAAGIVVWNDELTTILAGVE